MRRRIWLLINGDGGWGGMAFGVAAVALVFLAAEAGWIVQKWEMLLGKWDWEIAWTAAGVAANVGLGYVAIKALNEARRQADAAEVQAMQLQADRDKERRIQLEALQPNFYVGLRDLNQDEFRLMISNAGSFPVVFTDLILYTRTRKIGLSGKAKGSFFYSSDNKSDVLMPQDTIYPLEGNYDYWSDNLCGELNSDPASIEDMIEDGELREDLYNIYMNGVELDGIFRLILPFTQLSPDQHSYAIEIKLVADRIRGQISLMDYKIVMWGNARFSASGAAPIV